MLVTNRKLLDAAREGGYAVGAFNINNMEFIQAITETAAEHRSPVIIAVSEGALKYAGFENLFSMVEIAAGMENAEFAIHLDHGRDMEVIEHCIDNGFTSVMIDGSHLPFDENIEITREVVEKASPKGVSVEGELGKLAGGEDNISVSEQEARFTNPDEAAEFVERTGVDALAVAIGTSHGAYKFKGEPQLAMDILEEIASKVSIPLVLHGASGVNPDHVKLANQHGADIGDARGVPDDAIRAAVKRGICKVNIDTDMRIAFTAFMRKKLAESPDLFDPRKYLGAGRDGVREVVRTKIELFGSAGKTG
ncbi:MAG: class II fructose-1,6-bisphosphate aldolase [Candidatus Latescibacteria bacterium]|nr:class II fructose-1,6-bisphosphate aldolase [bacterium]MBD3423371.1 class II fructose-1,6-bisphosphate aldolase [Candidatus Latescibacterota bacterium]